MSPDSQQQASTALTDPSNTDSDWNESQSTITLISAESHEQWLQLVVDLWAYRELFWTLVMRDIKVRYKQTVFGVGWVILQPLLITGAFSLIFGRIAKMPTDGLPYALFYLGALVPWNTFVSALQQMALSMEANVQLISKVYFPRIIVPGAMVWASFLDFGIGWLVLNVLAIVLGHWSWLLIAVTPLLILIQGMTALGMGLVLASLNAQYRDVKHAIGFMLQMFMLATPVIYPASSLPALVRPWLFLNPMAGVVMAYRAVLKGQPPDWPQIALSGVMALLYLAAGTWFFRRREGRLVDIL